MIRRALRVLPLLILPLAGCAQHYHPPVIRYDDAVQATRLPDPPKPVQVVEVPQLLPLPGQLKPLPSRRITTHPAPEVADPTARVTQANLAAHPAHAGRVHQCGAGLSLFSGRSLSGLHLARRNHRHHAPAG
ncbi:conjugal transfer protein TrbG [Gluconobacter thailandicus F149-1 = NBRC 100600]|nr:conjugal transfer protein TrbG [Gluconobacter thailandicus F149-1 = NBRC 100600]GBR61318.1 conjugal transfer protein TrbG [Gluconobacter thailandicus F149-1 = NBRC 100600]GEL88105.1 hypothetical protein GTH01_24630 [Gluconobacter thailandicus F149-1 = NBRC 100600]